MSKEIKKSDSAKIVGQIKEYKGKKAADIREYVETAKYTGFTKAGLWIEPEIWQEFVNLVLEIDAEMKAAGLVRAVKAVA